MQVHKEENKNHKKRRQKRMDEKKTNKNAKKLHCTWTRLLKQKKTKQKHQAIT